MRRTLLVFGLLAGCSQGPSDSEIAAREAAGREAAEQARIEVERNCVFEAQKLVHQAASDISHAPALLSRVNGINCPTDYNQAFVPLKSSFQHLNEALLTAQKVQLDAGGAALASTVVTIYELWNQTNTGYTPGLDQISRDQSAKVDLDNAIRETRATLTQIDTVAAGHRVIQVPADSVEPMGDATGAADSGAMNNDGAMAM